MLNEDCLKPLVSVVIPTYNRSLFIGDAIASVLRQSYSNFEIIVVDDGSTDSTDEVVNSFSDPRLIHIKQKNQGRSAARNNGIKLARGRFIAFLDSDDLYLQGKLAAQIAYMEKHPEFGMIYTTAYCINSAGTLLEDQPFQFVEEGNIYKRIAFFQPLTITLPTVMVRRDTLDTVGDFDESMERFEDTDLWRRIAKHTLVGAIDLPTCHLRTHEDNTLAAQDPKRIMAAVDYYVSKIVREDADMGIDFLNSGASRLYEYYAKALLSVPGWRSYGFKMLRQAVTFRPARIAAILTGGIRAVIRSYAHQYFRIA